MRPRSVRACSVVNAMVLLPELGRPVSHTSAPFCSSRSSRWLARDMAFVPDDVGGFDFGQEIPPGNG